MNYCNVRLCEFSPAFCMKREAFYRKPHIVSKTHNASPTGSTVFGNITLLVCTCDSGSQKVSGGTHTHFESTITGIDRSRPSLSLHPQKYLENITSTFFQLILAIKVLNISQRLLRPKMKFSSSSPSPGKTWAKSMSFSLTESTSFSVSSEAP